MAQRKLSKASLTKYKKIIDEWFVNGFCGKTAYKKFYKKVKDNTAMCNFSKIQNLPEMKVYIKEKHKLAANLLKTSHEGILERLILWVSSDITQTLTLTFEKIKELPIEVRQLITKYKKTSRDIYGAGGVKVETVDTVELHFVSKEKAIEMINKHVGFYEIDNKQKAAVIDYGALTPDILKTIWDARKTDTN